MIRERHGELLSYFLSKCGGYHQLSSMKGFYPPPSQNLSPNEYESSQRTASGARFELLERVFRPDKGMEEALSGGVEWSTVTMLGSLALRRHDSGISFREAVGAACGS